MELIKRKDLNKKQSILHMLYICADFRNLFTNEFVVHDKTDCYVKKKKEVTSGLQGFFFSGDCFSFFFRILRHLKNLHTCIEYFNTLNALCKQTFFFKPCSLHNS